MGKKLRNYRSACAVVIAVALLCGAGFVSAAINAIDKDAVYQEMLGLAQQMSSLKAQVGTSSQAAAAYAVAESRYQDLSRSLGGDDPGHALNGAPPSTELVQRIVPGAPAGCNPATANFTQSTPTAIPAGPAVVTSTVVVSGAGPYLFDLDVTTTITHTFPGDIDMTLTSPAGTVVTLTTDNAGTNDDVFNGTVWDDDANPAGQVPYATNNGTVNDHAYVISTLASPLTPEEPLAAFIGEDPNGTWTITISDDAGGDSGNLADWSLGVTTFAAAPTTANTTATQSTPTAIPAGPAVVTSTLVVAGAGTSILDVDLTTFITHTFPGDIDMTLTSPAGTVVTVTTDNAGTNDDVYNGTVWDDDANPAGQVPYATNNGLVTDHAYVISTLASPLTPEEPLGAFIGEDPNGTWTITISDDAGGDSGNLASWSLDIDTFTCALPDADVSMTKTLTTAGPIEVGDNLTFALTVTNDGPGGATGVTVTDTLPAGLTYVSNDCGATFAAPTLTWNVGALAASASATCNLTVTATQAGVISNTATATSNETDPVPADNSSTATVTIVPPPGTVEIPTLGGFGLAALVALLAASAAFVLRRRRA